METRLAQRPDLMQAVFPLLPPGMCLALRQDFRLLSRREQAARWQHAKKHLSRASYRRWRRRLLRELA
jgi:hypothetical protein